ncbi:Protein CBR-CLEC-199 [Caenorhabditis briggsae]|uniref:Protein CBR-CLEC-199 n=1 Tax=Caenorhabditis briggsae TaxID=6238 RepID=A8WMZ8_CAEBR|nr:Protein CBR-CLEC-199 [Caenorhabditis briggsae]CAP21853.2 Protein CBR-CLEC-199 [Caenorhabditis briggsae]
MKNGWFFFLVAKVLFIGVFGNNKKVDNIAVRQILVSNFVADNREVLKQSDGSDERYLFKAMNQNSLIPPESSSSLQDESQKGPLVLSDAIGTAKCASGWIRWEGNGCCYKEMGSPTLSWYASEDWCWNQRAGAHLASVHSQAEAVWLNYQYKVWYSKMDDWIGLRRNCDNTAWEWTDGTPVDFLWWQPNYPIYGGIEDSCTAKIQGPGRSADFNSECVRLGGKLADVSGAGINEALRLAFSTNTLSITLEEAWISASGGYSNLAFGSTSSAGSCLTIILSQSDNGIYSKRGVWKSYACTSVKEFGICEKAI